MKKRRKRNRLYALISMCVCLVLYLSVGFLIIGFPSAKTVDDNVSVADTRGEDFAVLLCCDELSQYAALYAEPQEERLTLTLFCERETAENFGFNYKRRVEYDKISEINLIGWLGGIVIQNNICYNTNGYGQKGEAERLLGASAVELSQTGSEARAAVAHEILFSLLERDISGKEFSQLLSLAQTDISYTDCLKNYGILQDLKYNIIVQTVN